MQVGRVAVVVLCVQSLVFSSAPLAAPEAEVEAELAGIETLMSAEQRAATGVAALSPAELQALNSWLAGFLAGRNAVSAAVQNPPPATVTAPAEPERTFGEKAAFVPVESTIVGEFTGWSGETVFTLANGQIYKQRRPGEWKTHLANPSVRISSNFMGALDLEVVAAGRSIGVRRLR